MIPNNIKNQNKLNNHYIRRNEILSDLKNNFSLNVAYQLLLVSLSN